MNSQSIKTSYNNTSQRVSKRSRTQGLVYIRAVDTWWRYQAVDEQRAGTCHCHQLSSSEPTDRPM